VSTDDDGRVHRPGDSDVGATETDGGDSYDRRDGDAYVHRPGNTEVGATGADDADDGLGRAGWVLVGVVVLSVLVVPGVIYLYPAGPGNLGFPFLAAMLALPMVPALLLGATAIWSLKAGD
jgi:hypothetical protein